MAAPPPPVSQRGYQTAAQAAQAHLAQVFYSAQALLAATATRDIIAIWQQLNLRDVRGSWPAIRTALAGLIRDRFGMSASQAGAYYVQARQAAGVPGPAPRFSLPPLPNLHPLHFSASPAPPAPAPAPASLIPGIPPPVFPPPAAATPAPGPPVAEVPPPSPQLIQATLDSTGPYSLLGRIKQGQRFEPAAEAAGVRLSGAASRLIQNGSRQVVLTAVQADSEAVGWMRILGTSRTGPCAFCSMLASRGPDFKTRKSALAYWHDHCKCEAQPVFSIEDAKALRDNDLYEQWKTVTKGHSKHQAFLAWRRYWDNRTGRDGIRVLPAA